MPDKKRTMNDMVVTKKPVVKKQVLSVPKKVPIQKVVQQEPEYREEDFEEVINYDTSVPRKNRSGCFLWIIAMICSIALVLGIGGLFTHAKVSVTPKQFSGVIDLSMSLSQANEPGTVFFGTATKTFTAEKVVPSTGVAPSETFATGMVKFYNTNTTSKTIPAKTEIVSTAGKKYAVNKSVTVPAKATKEPGQVESAMTAVVAGGEGNSALDDFAFSKPTKTLAGITMHSVGEITGGLNSADAVADPQAIDAASDALKQEFSNTKNFIARLAEQVPDSMIALPLVLPENPVTITLDPKHADGVHVIASKTVTIVIVNRADVARMIGNDLNIPENVKLDIKDFGDAIAMTSSISTAQPIPQKLIVRMTGESMVMGSVNLQEVEQKVLGISRKDAKAYLSQLLEVGSYKLTMRPFWRRVIPLNTEDVEVIEK